jgi:hypothetical protein
MPGQDQPPLSPEEFQRRMRAGELSIESASTNRVQAYRPEIDRILRALGHPEAFVTDESCLRDFPLRDDEDVPLPWLTDVEIDLGVRVRRDDYLVDVAQRMREVAERQQRTFLPTERHAWVGWLGERDAQVLLLSLFGAIEKDGTLASLQEMVAGWREHAHHALSADDWRACVDKFLEVYVDARIHIFARDRFARAGEDDET